MNNSGHGYLRCKFDLDKNGSLQKQYSDKSIKKIDNAVTSVALPFVYIDWEYIYIYIIRVMSSWRRWRLKSLASGLFAQPFVQAQIKENTKFRATGLCEGTSPVTGGLPSLGPVTRKMFPFHDVIMICFFLYLIVGKHFASTQALHRLLHVYCFSITATNGILNQAYRICISKARHNSLQSLTMELNIHKLLTPAITEQIRWYRNTVK